MQDSSRGNTKQGLGALNQSRKNRWSIQWVDDPEPYGRLTDKPDKVVRSRSKHWPQAGERKGGGKRLGAG